MSKLYFRYGAMNCGKSTALIQVAHNYEERGMNVIVIKPQVDSKGKDSIVSRIGATRRVDKLIDVDFNIYNYACGLIERDKRPDCILVDEVQFLKSCQVDQLLHIAVKLNIPVVCYGLRTDFQMNGFEGSTRLLLIAHSIEELKTICRCGKKATQNARLINGEFVFEGEQIAIDSFDKVSYESVCSECYIKMRGIQ
ncbi:MAG: thymidine kinase [Clostridium sp.]|uniref:thymidine kinase n=1 Tax=Clostridium sp. TaxID=1506 RepID=UPI002FC78B4F